jgi:dUTP pyrophosphatase
MIIKFCKMHEDVQSPVRENPSDAGLDVRLYAPEGSCKVYPGSSVVLPTGIKIEVPHGYAVEVKNRSGVASKRQLIVGACVIDSGYAGQIFINLHNVGPHVQELNHGDKIAQLVMYPIVTPRLLEVEESELYRDDVTISARGEGGFGSTGQ